MDFDLNPDFEEQIAAQVQDAAQQAINATKTAFDQNDNLDVEARLRSEFETGGVSVGDEDWLAQIAKLIRRGQPIAVVGELEQDAEGIPVCPTCSEPMAPIVTGEVGPIKFGPGGDLQADIAAAWQCENPDCPNSPIVSDLTPAYEHQDVPAHMRQADEGVDTNRC